MKSKLSKNALEVAQSRYFMEGEDWEKCAKRCGEYVASIEKEKDKYSTEFSQMIFDMNFLPGGRILRNAGRSKGSLFNCFHLPIGDSIEEIGQCLKDSLILWSEGGGVGINFSPLRPKGDKIMGKGGKSSGLVSFIEAFDHVSHTIESGGSRRAAAIAHVDVAHPEVIDFIDAKLEQGLLSHFNISVAINEFFLEAVEQNRDWEFRFKQKGYEKIPAKEIWDKIVNNMLNCAEPGLMNWDKFTKNNSWYFSPILGCNPCVTGDTLVAVADGRNYVPIKQLAEEGKDVLVHCSDKNGNPKVRMGRNPRKTQNNVKIYKIILDDGSFVRATENHKFVLKDGSKVELKNLKINDSLMSFNKYQSENDKMYWTIYNGNTIVEIPEHKMISEYYNGPIKPNHVCHHIDGNSLNNNYKNLKYLTISEHNLIEPTITNRVGELNGMFGKYHKTKSKNQIREKAIEYFSNEENRKLHSDIKKQLYKDNPEIKEKISKSKTKEREIIEIKCKYCGKIFKQEVIKDNPRHKTLCSTLCQTQHAKLFFNGFTDDSRQKMSEKAKKYSNSSEGKKSKRKAAFISIKNKALKIGNLILNNGNEIHKNTWDDYKEIIKEYDIKHFIYEKTITKLWNNEWDKFNEECTNYNHKIVDIIEDGYEDVYNITVDEFHNYGIITNTNNKTRIKGYTKLSGIISGNCGETTLGASEVCCLGSLVLPKFITGNKNTNWIKLEQTINLAIRFLDNIIEVNKYALKQNDIAAHNSRRIGLGVMGLAEYLFAKKVRYGSEKSISEIERVIKFVRDKSYEASVKLAIEKGSFPKYDSVLYPKSSFIKKLPAPLRIDIKKYGIRNVTLMAMAPNGSISLLADVTSGIEPLFAKAYLRKDRVSERIYIHPIYEQKLINKDIIIEDNEEEWFVDTLSDLKPQDHFEVQVAVQKYTDGSVSKTINVPEETTSDDLSKLLLEYIRDLKGCTVYRDGSREGQIINKISEEEVISHLKENKNNIKMSLSEDDVKCKSGSCEL